MKNNKDAWVMLDCVGVVGDAGLCWTCEITLNDMHEKKKGSALVSDVKCWHK